MKKYFFLLSFVFLLAVFPVSAQDISTPENSSTTTLWNPLSLNSSYLTSYYYKAGDETVFHGTITNYDYNTFHRVLISIEIYNEDYHRVAQVFYNPIPLNFNDYINVELISPRSLPPGRYYYTVGVYDAQSFKLMGWYPAYQQFTVYE